MKRPTAKYQPCPEWVWTIPPHDWPQGVPQPITRAARDGRSSEWLLRAEVDLAALREHHDRLEADRRQARDPQRLAEGLARLHEMLNPAAEDRAA